MTAIEKPSRADRLRRNEEKRIAHRVEVLRARARRHRDNYGRARGDPLTWEDWKRVIRERDRWRCLHCGRSSKEPPHHIDRVGGGIEAGKNSHDNLILLCATHHAEAHEYVASVGEWRLSAEALRAILAERYGYVYG